MDKYHTIIRPLVTEQGTHQAQTLNAYAFQVNPKSNKTEIKDAIEKIYNVKVKEVRTANRKGKPRRRGYTMGTTGDWKKAVVVLDENHVIDVELDKNTHTIKYFFEYEVETNFLLFKSRKKIEVNESMRSYD